MRKRSKYRPKPVLNPIGVAIESAAIISTKRLDELRREELGALARMARGTFDDATWTTLLYVANQAELMASEGVGHEVLGPAAKAQVALAKMRARRTPDGTWRATPGEVFDLREVQEYHDLQRQSVPYGTYLSFTKRTQDKMRTGSLPTHEQILENSDDQPAREV